jgi:hypothetical protein
MTTIADLYSRHCATTCPDTVRRMLDGTLVSYLVEREARARAIAAVDASGPHRDYAARMRAIDDLERRDEMTAAIVAEYGLDDEARTLEMVATIYVCVVVREIMRRAEDRERAEEDARLVAEAEARPGRYVVVPAPGCYGDEAIVVSDHRVLKDALAAVRGRPRLCVRIDGRLREGDRWLRVYEECCPRADRAPAAVTP